MFTQAYLGNYYFDTYLGNYISEASPCEESKTKSLYFLIVNVYDLPQDSYSYDIDENTYFLLFYFDGSNLF